jgi:hypothetical protein
MTQTAPQKAEKSGLAASTIRIGKRYRANRLNGDYDAIVIGSGHWRFNLCGVFI